MTVYIVDSDVFVQAANQTYRMSEFPGYWHWMELLADIGRLASVQAVKEELVTPNVSDWADSLPTDVFRQPDATVDEIRLQITQWVLDQPRFTDRAKDAFIRGADCHLIAEAAAHGGIVVTYEVPAPNSRTSVKIPDVCQAFGIECIYPHDMLSREGARFVLDDSIRQSLLKRIPLATR